MTDIHTHILWGLDDGATDAQETLAMLQLSASQGVTCIAATVHAYPGERFFDMDAYTARLSDAKALCEKQVPKMTLISGAEIAATHHLDAALRSKKVPTLGGSDYVLIELWHNIDWQKVYAVADSVLKLGYIPIFAHVERYSCFVWEPKRALRFRLETGTLLQLNANTLLCGQGLLCGRFLNRMLAEQGIDIVASDAHHRQQRAPNLGLAYQYLVDRVGTEYAERLTHFEVMGA